MSDTLKDHWYNSSLLIVLLTAVLVVGAVVTLEVTDRASAEAYGMLGMLVGLIIGRLLRGKS